MDQETRARTSNLYRIAGIVAVIMVALTVYGLVSGINRFALGAWIALAIVCGAAIFLARRGKIDLGAWLILGVALAFLPFSAVSAQGAGVFLAVIAMMLASATSFLTLSSRWQIWALAAGAASAIACILLDAFGSPTRPTPLNFTATILVTVAVAALYAVFLLRNFPRFNLRTKIVTVALALTLIPLVILAVVNLRISSDALIARTGASLKALSETEGRNVDALLESEVNNLDILSFDSQILSSVQKANAEYGSDETAIRADLAKLDQEWVAADAAKNDSNALVASRLNNAAADVLRHFREAYSANVEVFVTDRYGANVAATNRTSDFYQADEPWWQAAYNNGAGAVYIGQPEFDESSQTNAVNIAVPIFAADNKTVEGILRTTFSLQAISALLTETQPGQSGHVHILLPNNQTIGYEQAPMHQGETLAMLRSVPQDFVEVQSPGTPARYYTASTLSGSATPAGRAVSDLGWLVLVHQDRTEVLAPIEAQTRNAILLALVIAGLASLVAVGGAQFLTRPITRLTETAEKIRAGDLQARAPVESNDEIGTLATTFNSMTARMSELVGNLEQRVSDRTAVLEANNAYYVSLQDVSVGLLRRRDLDALLQDIIARAGELVGTKNGYVFLLNPETNEMVMRVGVGSYDNLVGTKAKLGVGLAGQVWETGQAIAVDDYRSWSGRLADSSRDILRAVVGVPLISENRVIGVIGLAHLDADKRFGSVELDVLNRFASLAALTLDNAQLYEASQRELTQRRNTEEFLDSILENLPTMLFVKEAADLRFVRWNKAGEAMTGRSRDEFVGKNDYDFFPREEADFFVGKDRETLERGETLDIPEEPLQRTDGSTVWLHTRKVPIMGADGKPAFLLGISEDITERKRTETALRESEERFRALTQSANDSIVVTDQHGTILEWNQGAERAFQYTELEAIGQPLALIMPERFRDGHAQGMERLNAGGEPRVIGKPVELVGLRKDGTEFPVELSLSRWSSGDKTYYSGILRDITERVRAEEAVRESEERYRDLFENANDLIQSVRADGFYEYVNRTWQELLGYSDEDLKTLTFLEVIHPDEREHCQSLFGRVMSGQVVADISTAFVTKDGRKILVEGDTTPRMLDGQVVSTRGIFRDVTLRRQAEEQIRLQAAALDSAANTIVITDPNGKIQWANRAFTQASGYSLEEAAGGTPRLLKSGMHEPAFYQNLWETILRGEIWSGEIINRRKNGELYYEEMTITPVRDEVGAISRFVAIKQDITERKRAQEREAFQNALLAAQYDVSPDGILVVGADDTILSANKRFAELWDISPDVLATGSAEALRQAARENIVDVNDWLERTNAIYANQEASSQDEVVFKNGRILERFSAPVTGVNDSYRGRVWFFHDVTESRRAETRMRDSEQRLVKFMSAMPVGVFVLDADAKPYFVNEAAQKLLGFEFKSELHQPYVPLDLPVVVAETGRELTPEEYPVERALAGEVVTRNDLVMRHPDREIPFQVSATPIYGAENKIEYALGVFSDITEIRRAEEDLRRVAEGAHAIFWRSTITRLPDASQGDDGFAWDSAYSNPETVREFLSLPIESGHSFDETFYSCILPEDREAMSRRTGEVFRQGRTAYSQEYRMRDKNGTLHWLYEDARVRQIDADHFEVIGLTTDITERKQAEAELERERYLFQTLMDNLPHYIYFKDRDSHFLRINNAQAHHLGIKDAAQAIGKSDFDYYTEDHVRPVFEEERRIMETGVPLIGKEEYEVFLDGKTQWETTTKMPLRGVDGEIIGTFGVSMDITQLKVAEQELREKEALYASLVETIPQALTRKDLQGRVVFGNRRFFEDVQKPPEEIYGKTDFDFHPRELAEKYWQDDLRVMQGGETIEAIEPHERGDGVIITVRVVKTPTRNAAGEIDGMQVMFWDITEEEHQKELVRQQNVYLNALQDTSLGLVGRLDVKALLQDIVARAGQLVGTEHGYVFIREPGAEEMEMRVGVGAYEGFVGRRTKEGVGLAGEVWQKNAPIVVDDYRQYGGRLADASRDILRAVTGVPLRSGKQVVGVIGLAYLDETRKFGEAEMVVLERFAQLAAIALDNARLYESAQLELAERTRTERLIAAQADRIRALLDVSLELGAPGTEAHTLLDLICKRSMTLADADGAGVWIPISPEELELQVTYNVGTVELAGRRLKRGEGLSGRVFESGEAFKIDDYLAWTNHAVAFEDAPFYAAFGAPIVWQNETIGVLALTRSQPNKPFTQQDEQIAQLMAAQAGAAIANARLYKNVAEELEQRTRAETALAQQLRETELLNRVTSHAVSFDVDRALIAICADLADYFRVEQTGIALLSADHETLTVVADHSPQDAAGVLGYVIPVKGNPSTEIVLETRRPAAFSDAQNDPRLASIRTLMQERKTASILIAPLFVRDEIIGTVGIDSFTPREFADADIALVERVANAVSTALENARLYNAVQQELTERTRVEAQMRQRNAELESLNRVASSMMQNVPVEISLTEMARELVKTFRVRNCGIALLNSERTDLTVVADALTEGHEQHSVGIVIPVAGNASSEYVIQHKESLVIDDPQTNPLTQSIHERMRDRNTTCLAIVPLLAGEQVIGTIGLDTTEPGRVFSEDEIRVAETMASQMASAIEKQRLLEATQREVVQRTRAEQVQATLFRIADAVNLAGTTGEFYAILHSLIAELVPAPNMYVAMYHPEEDALEFVYFKDEHDALDLSFRRRSPAGKSITGWVVKQGQPLIGDEAKFVEMAARGEIELRGKPPIEWLGVPLKRGSETFGMFTVQSYTTEHVYTPEDLELLLALTPEITNAITRRQEQDALVRRNRELAVLNRITQTASAGTDLNVTLSTVAQEMIQVFEARNCGIALFTPDAQELVVVASATRSPEDANTVGIRIPIQGNPSTQRVLDTRASLVIQNAQTDPLTEPIHDLMHERQTHSLMIVPLLSGGQIIGTVGMDLTDPERTFSPQDVTLAETIASQMANAIEKQRLFDQTSERAQELAVINRTANVISQELDLEKLFENVREQISNLMPTDAFFVMLFDTATQFIEYPYVFDDGQRFEMAGTELSLRSNLRAVIESGKPMLLNRTAEQIAAMQSELTAENAIGNVSKVSASLLYAPMWRGNEIIGCLSTQSYSMNAYSERDLQLVEGIASHLAVALKNAQLFRETEESAQRFAALNRIARAVTTPTGFDALAQAIYQEINALLNPDAFFMALYSPAEKTLDFRMQVDRGVVYPPDRTPVKDTLAGEVIESGAPLLISDLLKTENPDRGVLFGSPEDVRTWLGVPLHSGANIIGVLSIQSYAPDKFTPAESNLLQTIADQIGVAVERARLFDETEKRAAETAIINELARSLSGQLERNQLFETVYSYLPRLLPSDAFMVWLYDKTSGTVTRPALYDKGEFFGDEDGPRKPSGNMARVIETGEPIALNLSRDEWNAEKVRTETILGTDTPSASMLYVPLRVRGELSGVISVQSYGFDAYAAPQIAVLTGVANHLASALDNVELFQETASRLNEVTILNTSMRSLTENLEASVVLPKIAEQFRSALNMDTVTLENWDETTREMVMFYDYDTLNTGLAEAVGTRFPETDYPDLEEYFTHGISRYYRIDDPTLPPDVRSLMSRYSWQTYLVVPLVNQNRLRGVIDMGDCRRLRDITADELRLASSLASQVTVVLDNARLYSESRRRVAELQFLNESLQTLTSEVTLDALLPQIVAQFRQELDMDTSSVLLHDPEMNEMVMMYDFDPVPGLQSQQGQRFALHEYPDFAEFFSQTDIKQYRADEKQLTDSIRNDLSHYQWKTLVLLPLLRQGKTVGLVELGNRRELRTFSTDELRLAENLAAQSALAMEKAQLFDQMQNVLAETQLLYRTGSQLNQVTTLEELVFVAAQPAFERGAGSSQLLLLDYDQENRPIGASVIVSLMATGEPPPQTPYRQFPIDEFPFGKKLLENPRELIFVENVDQATELDAATRTVFIASKTHAVVFLPLTVEQRILGLIVVGWPEAHAFDPQERRVYQGLVGQLAVVLNNRLLLQQTEQALAEVRTLYEISARLNAANTMQEALEAASGPAVVQGASSASLLRIHMDSSGAPMELELIGMWPRQEGEGLRQLGTRVPLGMFVGASTWVSNPFEPVVFADILNDPRIPATTRDWLAQTGVRATAALPLKVSDRWIGLLSISWNTPHPFAEKDLRLYRSIMAQAAIVLDNRSLFDQTQTALQQTQEALVRVQQAQDRLNLQFRTAQLLAGAAEFHQVSVELLQVICEALDWELGEYWEIAEDNETMYMTDVWHDGTPKMAGFVEATNSLVFRRGEGLAGTTWARGEPIWVENVLTDSNFKGAGLAHEAGLVSAFGFPLGSEVRAFGVAVFFSNQFQELDEPMVATMQSVGNQIVQYLERVRAESALRESEAQLAEALRVARLGNWEYDVARDDFTFTDSFYSMMRTSAEAQGGYHMSSRTYAERFVYPDDMAIVGFEIQNSLETADPNYQKAVDHRVIFGDGQIGYVTVNIRIIKDGEGRTVGVYGANLDITERKRAEEAVRQQNAYLTALHDTTLGLMRRLDLDELLQNIIARAGELVGTEHGYVHLIEPNGNELRMRVGIGLYQDFIGTRVRRGQGLAGTVWQTDEPIVVDDYRYWQGRLPMVDRDVLRAVVGVPLQSGDQTVGVLGLASTTDGRVFTPEQVDALKRFAELATVALDNARLYEATQSALKQTQRVAEREKTSAEIADRLYAAPDIKFVLQTAADELRRATGSKRAVVRLKLGKNGDTDSKADSAPNGDE